MKLTTTRMSYVHCANRQLLTVRCYIYNISRLKSTIK
jgi:hypothetical protein